MSKKSLTEAFEVKPKINTSNENSSSPSYLNSESPVP